jgi:hypothetical protein
MSFLVDYFSIVARDYYLRHTSTTNDVRSNIIHNGFAVLPNFIDKNTVLEMSKHFPKDSELRQSPEGTRTLFFVNADNIDYFK